jgi:hypothetical protein
MTIPQPNERELRSRADFFFHCMEVCASLVALGVIFENVSNFTTCLYKVGGALIALGIVAELLFGRLHKVTEDKLRGLLDATIAELNLENTKLRQQLAGDRFTNM